MSHIFHTLPFPEGFENARFFVFVFAQIPLITKGLFVVWDVSRPPAPINNRALVWDVCVFGARAHIIEIFRNLRN